MTPRRPYTILHTESSRGWGGQERRILSEAQAMRERGHRLLIACDPRGELFGRAREAGFPVFPLKFGGLANIAACVKLRHHLHEAGVEILNTHSSLDSWVGLMAWKSLRTRPVLVRTRHLSTPVRRSRPTRWLYQTPGAVITTGEATRELLATRVGVPRERIFSIPTGICLEDFAPRAPEAGLRTRLDLPADAFVFGIVAVLRSWKGHLYLLEALKELITGGAPAFLVVVGKGPYREVIRGCIRELGLGPWVRLVGYHDDVAPWLALMDAVVLPSYSNEGVPQALIQAMVMGRPVVGAAIGGIPEIVIPGQTGLLTPPRDPHALAQAMRRLMEDAELCARLGRGGRDLVCRRFSLESMAEQVERVYDGIVGGGPGGR